MLQTLLTSREIYICGVSGGKNPLTFGDRGNLKRGSNHEDKVYQIFVMLRKTIMESCRKVFTKEGDIRLSVISMQRGS